MCIGPPCLVVPAANAAATIDQMNLPQYFAPLYPLIDSVALQVAPLMQKATNNVLPHISPYLDLAAPYIGGAKPHLDKVGQKELLIIVGQSKQQSNGRRGSRSSGDPLSSPPLHG